MGQLAPRPGTALPIAFVAFGCMAGSGCSESDGAWTGGSCASERFVYYVRDQDRALCPAQTELLEQHATVFTELLALDASSWAKVHYYKYADAADLNAAGKCGGIGDACTFAPEIHTTRAFDQHELFHAYTANAWKPVLFAEGVAEALTCRTLNRAQSCSGDWRALLNQRGSQAVYDCGARLIYRLLTRGPPSQLTSLAARIGASSDPERFASAVRERYGVELDAIWNGEVLGESRYCVPFWECAGEELIANTREVTEPATARLRLPARSGMLVRLRYRDVGVPGAVELVACGATATPDPDDHWQTAETSAPDVWLETAEGGHALELSGGALTIDVEPGQFAESCAGERRYALELGRPLSFLLRHDNKTRFFPLTSDRARQVEFVVKRVPAGFGVRWCAQCTLDQATGCTELAFDRDGRSAATIANGVLEVKSPASAEPSGVLLFKAQKDDRDP